MEILLIFWYGNCAVLSVMQRISDLTFSVSESKTVIHRISYHVYSFLFPEVGGGGFCLKEAEGKSPLTT